MKISKIITNKSSERECEMTTSLEECLISLSSENDWHGVIEAGKRFDVNEKSKFLWAWPNVECFEWLKAILNANKIKAILSIGCGSGILEWVIIRATAVRVIGVELDNSWWQSKYAPKTFIPLKFTEHPITNQFLRTCIQCDDEKEFALLFCYFNNRGAFHEYVRAFDGDIIIIVGPTTEKIVTDPNPLNPHFERSDDWTLVDVCQFNDQLSNCMSVFRRIK